MKEPGEADARPPWRITGHVDELPRLYLSGGESVVLDQVELQAPPAESGRDTSPLEFPGRIQVYLGSGTVARLGLREHPLAPGETLSFPGILEAPPENATPGTFDLRRYLHSQRIYAEATVARSATIERDSGAPRSGLLSETQQSLWSIHRRAAALFERTASNPAALATLQTMALGRSAWTWSAPREDYFQTGMLHLFAVSGLHTGLLALLLYGMGRLCGLGPRGTAWLVLLVLPLYLGITGFRASVARAVIMSAVVLSPYLLRMGSDRLSALALAAWGIVLIRPEAIWQPGFHLSFAAVAGILVLASPLAEAMTPRTMPGDTVRRRVWTARFRHWVAMPVAVYLGLMASLLPLLVVYYHRVPILGGVANVLAIPLASLTLLFGFLAGLVSLVLPDAALPLARLAHFAAHWQNEWVVLIARGPLVSVTVGAIPAGTIAGYYLLIYAGRYWRLWPRRPWSVAAFRAQFAVRFAAGLLLLLVTARAAAPDGTLRVVFLDVGQGDATVVELPGGATLLVDGGPGGPADRGRRVVLPYLRHQGIARLDAVVATHHDADHIGGLPAVLEEVGVDWIIDGEFNVRDTETAQEWHRITAKGRRRLLAARGLVLRDHTGASVYVLSPGERDSESAPDNSNERSVVLLIDSGEQEVLLMGDAGFEAEAELVRLGLLVDVDVLKAGHHGSRYSGGEAFLTAIQPETVVISVGERNPYGHPHSDAMARYSRHSEKILSTAEAGTIVVETD